MSNLGEKIKNSSFFVNKIYILFIFFLLILEDFNLGFYYFLFGAIFYSINIMTARVPIEFEGSFEPLTYNYKKTESKDLKLDLWLPENPKTKNPMVFFCHGGGWISGFRNQPNNVSWCKYLASQGLAVVSIDYRYGFKNTMEDILSDYSDALSYVKNHNQDLKIDKDNIVLMGLSAGAHLSLLYASYFTAIKKEEMTKGIKAVVSYYGPSDLCDILEDDNKSLFAKFALKTTIENEDNETEKLLGKNKIYQYYSPISWVGKSMIPCLLVHGMKDNTVPYQSSLKLYEKLKDLNVEVELLSHPEADHVFDTSMKDKKTKELIEATKQYIIRKIGGNNENK